MNVDKKIKEISDYFKQKIVDGDYEITDIGSCTATIVVDSKHEFELWVSNGERNFSIYEDPFVAVSTSLKMKLDPEEKKLGWENIKPRLEKSKPTIKQRKIAELKALEEEIKNL